MKNRFLFVFLVGCLFASTAIAAWAQDDPIQPITLDNAALLTQITEITLTTQRLGIQFTPMTNLLAIWTDDGLTLYDPLTGEADEQLIEGPFDGYQFTADESQLYYSTTDGIQRLDMETMESETFVPDIDGTFKLSPDETLLGIDHVANCYVGGCTGELIIIDIDSGEQVFSEVYDSEYVNDFVFSPDGRSLAYAVNATSTWSAANQRGTGFPSAVVHLLDLTTMEDQFTLDVDRGVLQRMFFTPDSTQLIYTAIVMTQQFPSWDESGIHVLNVATGKDDAVFEIRSLARLLSPDGQYLFASGSIALPGSVTTGGDKVIMSLTSGEPISVESLFTSVVFDPNSTLALISGGSEEDAAIEFLNLVTGEVIEPVSIADHPVVYNVAFSPDGTLLVGRYSDDNGNHVEIWGVPTN